MSVMPSGAIARGKIPFQTQSRTRKQSPPGISTMAIWLWLHQAALKASRAQPKRARRGLKPDLKESK